MVCSSIYPSIRLVHDLAVAGATTGQWGRNHTPDILNPRHLAAVSGVLSITELAHVMHPETYETLGVDPVERCAMIHTRLLGRQIRHHLKQRITISMPQGTDIDIDDWINNGLLGRSRYIWSQASPGICSRDSLRYQLEVVLPDDFDWDVAMLQLSPYVDTIPDHAVVRLRNAEEEYTEYCAFSFLFYSQRFF